MVVAAVLLAFVTILWFYFLWSRRKYYAFALKMPGPKGLPIIGIGHKLFNNAETLYVLPKIASDYKVKTYSTWLGPYPIVYTVDPQVAELLINSPDCINKSLVYRSISDIVGEGIVTSKSPTWNKHRKLLNPCFSHKILCGFIPCFNKIAHELCGILEQHVDSGEVNVKEHIFMVGLKSAIATTFGVNLDEDVYNKTILESWRRSMVILVHRVTKPWLLNSSIFALTSMYKTYAELKATINNFICEMVVNRINAFEKHGPTGIDNMADTRTDSVDMEGPKHNLVDHAIRIHQNNEFTFNDVVSEAGIVVFAAYETTNVALFSTLLFLAMNPQYQEKLYEEIINAFPDDEFDVNYDDFKNLTYLDMCINETLRIAPSVPLIGRETTNDVPLSKDIIIPKGTQIFVDIFNIHRDEDIWGPDAKIYNPDNFLPSNLVGKHKYSFMPFSKGLRNCIGWQYAGIVLRVILLQVLRKYRFSTKSRYADLRFTHDLTLGYEIVPQLEIKKRHD